MRRIASSGLAALFALGIGCGGEHATTEQCQAIVDRIVYLELTEMGISDAKLVAQKQQEMRRVLAAELARCPGRPLASSAMTCVGSAKSTEALSHDCLR